MTTTVVNMRREDCDVYIGRPSKWGNRFLVGRLTRDQVVDRYRAWIAMQPQLLADLHELRGKRIGCYCAPLRCHGDVLAELADRGDDL